MSEPIPSGSAVPPVPPKKRSVGKIIGIIVLIVVVLCVGGAIAAYLLLGKAVDTAYAEGNCVDRMATGSGTLSEVPIAVSCDDAKAVAKILKVADDKTEADAAAVCGAVPGATSVAIIKLAGGSTKLLCLGPN